MISGQSHLLPGPGRGRDYERKALRIRRFAGVSIGARLDPYALASKLGLRMIDPDTLEALPVEVRNRLFLQDSDKWSGSVTPILPDGTRMVILNPRQSRERRTATLMEEVCHVLLGHEADKLDFSSRIARKYDEVKESEAYGVGAAALLPYHVLRSWLESLSPEAHILKHGETNSSHDSRLSLLGRKYGVSRSLVIYRLRIVSLWQIWNQIRL